MHFYSTENWHDQNNAAFANAVEPFGLNLFKPNHAAAPWHFQAVIDRGAETILINFWPHKMKAQREGCRAVEGVDAILQMVSEAFSDAERLQDFDVIED